MTTAFVVVARDEAVFKRAHVRRMVRSLKGRATPLFLSFKPSWQEPGGVRSIDGVEFTEITYADLVSAFATYPRKFRSDSSWEIMPGNLDLPHLLLTRRHPGIDTFWFCEDDVRYTGNLGRLVEELGASKADLLCTNLRPMPVDWFHVNSLTLPETWARAREPHVCFLPFFRASRRFFGCLDEAYAAGLDGHHEATFSAVGAHYELELRDVNSLRRRPLYTSDPDDRRMAPGSFVYRPAKAFAGIRRNALYHPVKGPSTVMTAARRRLRDRLEAITKKHERRSHKSLFGRLAQKL